MSKASILQFGAKRRWWSFAGGGSAWNIRLEKYAALDFTARLQLLLEDSHINSVAEDRQRLDAVLAQLHQAERDKAATKLLAAEANARLRWCCQLIKEEAENLQVILIIKR